MVTTAKITGKIIITSEKLDKPSQENRRKGWCIMEQIYIPRNIIEQAVEWRSNLCILSVNLTVSIIKAGKILNL